MNNQQIIDWLLEGDISIQYQAWRDLLGSDNKKLQDRIAIEGWGSKFLSKQHSNGHWGDRFYQPKWISTHYTLLDLRNLNLPTNNEVVKQTIDLVLQNDKAEDGGICLGPSTIQRSDVCVNGMFLNYASYFMTSEMKLHSIVDSILAEIMPDGGFNCRTTRSGARHSSLHSTISVLEGFTEFQKAGYNYRKKEISDAIKTGIEFILMHRLFLSDRTGQIIDKKFLRLTYPCRWRYDILRAMDYFQYAEVEWDNRMTEAITYLNKKQNKDGTWNVQAAHSGQIHFIMEKAGKPSRWNTLRMLRIKKYLGIE
ncbi:hypothetical protein QYS49_36195 [Marivirga salinae]|uniref:Squalene cyclase C-terminal domain-containing protein n=1 Tax=Marivirga salinarum TaxID=3059078 RepID=A0AA51N9B2_9BACT|nr:hypothetical protein [Marivirga sp. BDSF4-3]WMN10839.1 hypothetical protein QYS49_36195 [Marivirga sp. BDSF4-3]